MVGSARLKLIEIIAVTMLQASYENMVSIAQLEHIEVIVVALQKFSHKRSSSS